MSNSVKSARIHAILEGAKELLRTALFAAAAVIATSIPTHHIDWWAVAGAVATAVVSGLDKYVHEDPTIPANGISPI